MVYINLYNFVSYDINIINKDIYMPLLRNSNIISNALGNLIPGGFTKGNVDNFAKILVQKSPLEIRENDDAGGITSNPFNYGMLHYPEEVAQLGMGHYMIFDIIENNKQKSLLTKVPRGKSILRGAEDRVKGNLVTTGNQAGKITSINDVHGDAIATKDNRTHQRISNSIVLYTPPNLKTTFATEYEQAATGLAGAFGIKAVDGQLFEALRVIGREIVSAGFSVVPGVGDIGAVRTKVTGEAVNPNIETVFKSVPMREFNYTYDFAPKNKKELDMIDKIITLFKFHMLPDVTNGRLMLVTPSEFNITYMYLGKKNSYIPRVARCVLKSMEIDQTPENVLSTFMADDKGAFPTYTKVILNFLETEIMTKQKVALQNF